MSGRLTLKRADLVSALSAVARVVERRNSIPILSNVRLVTEGGLLHLTATDLDIVATASIAAEGDIATTIAAHLLHDIVKKLPDGAEVLLAMNETGTSMQVKSGRSNFKLQCLPVADFPDLSQGEATHRFTIGGKALAQLLSSCQFAISNEETRYYLNGVFMHTVDSGDGLALRTVATDGHRLARTQMHAPEGSEGMPGIIIPRKMVSELIKLGEDAGELDIALSDSKIIAETGAAKLVSKLIDGTFPDYTRVIPTGNSNIWQTDRKTLIAAADRVSTISNERGRAAKLTFADSTIVLTVNNPDSGEAREEVAATGETPVDIGFNAKYLTDVLGTVEGDLAEIALADSGSPTLFSTPGKPETLFVLMPMRV